MALLHEFLDTLAADSAKRTRFESNAAEAKKVMDEESLSAENQQLLMAGSDAQIRQKLKDELRQKAEKYVIRMSPQP